MTYLRKNVSEILGDTAFPYSFQFLYWEETGVIGQELVNNLLSCGAVIIVMIIMMIGGIEIIIIHNNLGLVHFMLTDRPFHQLQGL